jgi:hypothetical protein
MSSTLRDDDDDTPLWGWAAIAEAAGLTGRRHKIYRMLEAGLIPAVKRGRLYVSTRRAIRDALTPRHQDNAA